MTPHPTIGEIGMKPERAEEAKSTENRMTRIVMVLGIVAVWAFILSQGASG